MQRAGKAEPVKEIKASPTESENEHNSSAVSSQTGDENGGQLTDSEAGQMAAPDELAREEADLRAQREEGAKKALKDALVPQEQSALDSSRYDQLDKLLNQTGMYTTFLSEQLQAMDDQMFAETEAAAGQKRKAGKQGGRTRKKGAAAQTTAGSKKVQQELVPLIKGDLRPYQLKGIKWMVSLWNNGLNGILADQMGLGKTVQTIGLFAHLRSQGVAGPFMVIGPLSTLSNWVSEVQRWCPSMPVILYHGTQSERQALRSKKMSQGSVKTMAFPVVVTSYEIVIADSKHLARYQWNYIVVDEGHRLKNFNCKLLRELRTIPTNNKLLLSGTPLQNNLSELWSLLNFLLPDVFKDLADFEGWFDFTAVGNDAEDRRIVAMEQRNNVVSKLHKLLKPFLLRRIKSDVEDSLPAKQEILLYADMTKEQKKINQQLCDRSFIEAIRQAEEGRKAPLGRLNNMLMQMRNNCNHPDLITSKFDNSPTFPPAEVLVQQCGKLQLLDRLLTALKAGGHKVLIFSQMTKMLDLLDTYLEQLGHTSARIDGSIKWEDRQAAIKNFNEGSDIFCFLLSTRAGGLGINLTAADTVIIYDSDWNPHQDLQAMDRCHRIGQQKPVLVLRLATSHSVEGRLLKRARSKLALERLVIKKGAFLHQEGVQEDTKTSMKAEELVEILKGEDDRKETDVAQSGVISEEMLEKLLDRTHLEKHIKAPYPDVGVGYEMVQANDGSGLLSGVE
ncbi:g6105 [Coccomyxa viridis]|uniref:G6105 protein n=1 Tax=Coccomyxa viridis TaxID=1274662 RepID=A0ABP1FUJ7_9CHLO